MKIENFYKDLENKKKKIAVIGLGYVGLPLLISLSKYFRVIGFDINKDRINSLKNHIDKDKNIDKDELIGLKCELSSDKKTLKEASFFIIAVPTPIDSHKNPDLSLIIEATKTVGQNMPGNSIVVYESTFYPGVTEEICLPILEKYSKFKNENDFLMGYSPERINPGDKIHTLENIIKVVSGQNEASLDIISSVYGKIVKAGIFRAKNIKTAEAAKAIENTQRDLNIALINELSIIFSKLDIDTSDVLAAAATKWNFLNFYPGLVGGHCIGVDPYYLTYKANEIGYNPEVILAGRRINDNMSKFIGEQILKRMPGSKNIHNGFKVILFGITFKENISDIRNSKVIDIYNFLSQNNIIVQIYDPVANAEEVKKHYNINLINLNEINEADALVFCVAHDSFNKIDLKKLKSKMRISDPYLFDIKWIFNKEDVEKFGFKYWRI